MNDYKELIEETRGFANRLRYYLDEDVPYMEWEIDAVEDAADAIGQLVNDRNASVDALKALVENIDALPVVHGHWVAKKIMARTPFAINHYCSKCKFETDFCTNYCSNCGAKMDEVSE